MIYLDNNATTALDGRVAAEVVAQGERVGNASSLHAAGVAAALAVERAREQVAAKLGVPAADVYFTSGGTEANNMALKGMALAGESRRRIITARSEHASVLQACAWLARMGCRVVFVPVDEEGFVDIESVQRALRREPALVSVMHANNEIGTLQDMAALGGVCEERGAVLHTDGCQSFTKEGLRPREAGIAAVSVNAHKLHGPTGVGALYVRTGVACEPLLHGGGQERGLRSGTHHTAGIAGFGVAVAIAAEEDAARMRALRDEFIARVEREIDGVRLNGPRGARRLCNNINISIAGITGKTVMQELNRRGIMVATGSACASGKAAPSHVLTAIGQTAAQAHEAVRISLSKWTTRAELETAAGAIVEIVREVRGGRVARRGGQYAA